MLMATEVVKPAEPSSLERSLKSAAVL